jgi:hypothetical protein
MHHRAKIAILVALFSALIADRVAAIPAVVPPRKVRSLLLGSDSEFRLGQIRDAVIQHGSGIDTLEFLDVRSGIPTLDWLLEYDSISIHSDFSFPDPMALGNLLADYVDAGGGVVVMPFATQLDPGQPNYSIGGRWASGGYSPIVTGGGQYTGTWTLSTIDIPDHPILEGIEGIRYGGRFTPAGDLAPNAVRIAGWLRGDTPPESPLVAELIGFNGRVMLFNVYPEVGSLNDQGFRLLSNTLRYAAVPEPAGLSLAAFGVCGIGLGRRRRNRSFPAC